MNYSLKTQYESVKYYLAEKNNIVIFYKKHNLVLNNNFIGKSNGHFFLMEDELFYSEEGKDTTTTILNIKTKNLEEVNTILMKNTLYDNTFLQSTDLQMDEKYNYSAKISVFQFKPAKKLYDLPNRYTDHQHLRIGNFLITEKPKNTLRSLSLLTGEYEWEINIIEGKILSILGIHADTLIICLQQSGRDFSLLGIDIHTGKKTWHNDQNTLLNGNNLQFLQDKIFSVSSVRDNSYFIEIDLVTQKPLRYGDLESLKKNGIGGIFRFLIQDNHIYFTAKTVYESVESILGVMDYDTLEVLWWQKLDLPPFVILSQTPQVSENKLYVLDTAWVLHIFEREE